MKTFLIILLPFTFLFLGLLIYVVHYADHGPDGLGGFFMAIFYAGASVICMIGSISIGSIVLFPKTSSIIRFIGATLFSILIVYIVLGSTILPAIGFW